MNDLAKNLLLWVVVAVVLMVVFQSFSPKLAGAGQDVVYSQFVQDVQNDRDMLGWIRVSDGDPCAFCSMLLGRGPVYKEETAGFEAHDHCCCSAEPFAEGSSWPTKNREAEDLYYEAVGAKEPGESVVNAMRRLQTGQ